MEYHRFYRQEGIDLKVLIADNYPVERAGIKTILEDSSQISIIGETDCSTNAIDFVQQRACDLVVADTNTFHSISVNIIKEFKRIHPDIAILALGSGDEAKDIALLLRAGADGYFNKTSSNEELLQAIRTITCGKRYLSPDVEQRIGNLLDQEAAIIPHERLSIREREVLSLLGTGKTVTEIGKELSLSIKTISTYKSRIFEKLNISNHAHLIMYAFKNDVA